MRDELPPLSEPHANFPKLETLIALLRGGILKKGFLILGENWPKLAYLRLITSERIKIL